MKVDLHVTDSGRADLLLLKELQKAHPSLSRAQLKSYFQNGQVIYLGRPLSASHSFSTGQYTLEIKNWSTTPSELQVSDLPVPKILFENDELFALDKPSGMPSVPLDAGETNSAVSSALKYLQGTPAYKEFLSIGKKSGHLLEGGILHRLDTGTSGVLIFAKSYTEFERLKKAWKTDQVRKFYRALTEKEKFPAAPFLIDTEIGHDAKSAKKMISLPSQSKIRGNPLPARTHVLSITPESNHLSVSVEIETGVMHQIRVHLSSIGLPILGDHLYGSKSDSHPRLMLHHERIDLPLASGKSVSIISKPHW